jgi:hypothetical protein
MAVMGDMVAGWGMLIVETIAKVRRAYFIHKKPIKAISCEFRLSRKVVRKVIRSEATEFHYDRRRQPLDTIKAMVPEVEVRVRQRRRLRDRL